MCNISPKDTVAPSCFMYSRVMALCIYICIACLYTFRNKLIFENAVNKNASLPPPRAQTSDLANARNIQQFNELKFKSKYNMTICFI